MSRLDSLGEDGLIELLRKFGMSSSGHLNFSDDVALITAQGPLAISTDNLVEDIHFHLHTTSATDLGYKALAVSLSDLASKGARPVGCFLSWSLPRHLEVVWVEEFLQGFSSLSRELMCPLLGGDTTASPNKIFLSITVLGEVNSDAKLRAHAKVGDVIAVTGHLGDSSAGLEILALNQADKFAKLVARHRRPSIRIREGQWLAHQSGVHAMMDLSDGLWTDLPRLMKAAQKSALVKCEDVPVSSELKTFSAERKKSVMQYSIFGGEDFELMLTLDRVEFPRIKKDFESQFGLSLTLIGDVRADGPSEWNSSVPLTEFKAFKHF